MNAHAAPQIIRRPAHLVSLSALYRLPPQRLWGLWAELGMSHPAPSRIQQDLKNLVANLATSKAYPGVGYEKLATRCARRFELGRAATPSAVLLYYPAARPTSTLS